MKIVIGITLTIIGFLGVMALISYQREMETLDCSGDDKCFKGKVTQIVDGDTIKVNGKLIRFALADTPEIEEDNFYEAKDFVADICPVGTIVLVDEDDGQIAGTYERIIAEIHCNGVSLNEQVLEAGLAEISTVFCSSSEFSTELWAKKYGC